MRYVVTSVRESGTITYHCPTKESAVEKARDFQHAEYREIKVFADHANGAPTGWPGSVEHRAVEAAEA